MELRTFANEGPPASVRQEARPPDPRPALPEALTPSQSPPTAPERPVLSHPPLQDEDAEPAADLEAAEEEAEAPIRFTMAQDAGAPTWEWLRTYKVGLRVPSSLVDQFTSLMRKRQVLQFLLRRQRQRFSKNQQRRLAALQGVSTDPLGQAWAADLQAQGALPGFKAIQLVPLTSSEVCAVCVTQGRGLQKTRAAGCPYHEFECAVCGMRGDRHANAAHVAALLLQHIIEKRPLPLSTG